MTTIPDGFITISEAIKKHHAGHQTIVAGIEAGHIASQKLPIQRKTGTFICRLVSDADVKTWLEDRDTRNRHLTHDYDFFRRLGMSRHDAISRCADGYNLTYEQARKIIAHHESETNDTMPV